MAGRKIDLSFLPSATPAGPRPADEAQRKAFQILALRLPKARQATTPSLPSTGAAPHELAVLEALMRALAEPPATPMQPPGIPGQGPTWPR